MNVRILCLLSLLLPGYALQGGENERTPNVLLILADDLGIECLPSYGGHHRTPNLDKLAKEGMRFTHAFSHPYCSPSRATILTGQYPFRHGIPEVLYDAEKHADRYLDTRRPAFPRLLKKAGYRTAIAGKWQLGFLHSNNAVKQFGFDDYQLWQIFRADLTKTRRFHTPHLNRNGTIIADEIKTRYGPDVNADFLIEFMKASVKEDRPFFAYNTSMLPHFPWVPTPDSANQNYDLPQATHKGDPIYFPDMVTYLDKIVGRYMNALDELGIADNTVVLFVADNGTDQDLVTTWGDGKKIKGGKGSMTDRGTRVPLIVRWPVRIQAGSVCDDLIDLSDLYPTLCRLTGAGPHEKKVHGKSFVPRLLGQRGDPRTWIHVQKKGERHVRSRDYILDSQGEFRPVVEIWQSTAKPLRTPLNEEQSSARNILQTVFDDLNMK